MNIALEASCLADPRPTGIPRYTRSLALALADLLARRQDGGEITLLYRSSRFRRRHLLPSGPRLRRQMWRSGLWPLQRDYDILHTPEHRLPPWRRPRRIATIHDVYALVSAENFASETERRTQHEIYRRLAAETDQLLFISESTRSDFQRLVGGEPVRMHVTRLGVDPRFRPHSPAEQQALRERYRLAEPFLLFLGWQNPNKNLPRLLEAFAGSPLRAEYQLVLAGRIAEQHAASLRERIDRLGLAGRVVSTGYVPEPDVPALYAAAAALMFPSLYEGFGLPILEAMASGVPVLTSTTSSCPEVANGHAVLVDPTSIPGITAAIATTVATTAAARAAAREYAMTMTWDRTARATLAAYEQALAAPARPR
jgi:glycosyltransferase involved in cell wall biosynthesis